MMVDQERPGSSTRIYELGPPDVWGGYGTMLISGDAERNHNGQLLVYRTGPYMPPITLPGMNWVVVSDEFRTMLKSSVLTGLTFHPAIKHRIVELRWEHWDRHEEMPDLPTEYGPPIDLLLNMPHSEQAAAQLGPIWDARTERLVDVEAIYERHLYKQGYNLRLIKRPPTSIQRLDFFGAVNQKRVFVSERAKVWLEKHVPEWVTFRGVLNEFE
jgi:hypothetical protein